MSKEKIWQKINTENMVRHRSGTYYLQAMIGGKKIRRSLKTENLRIGKIKRDAMLADLRSTKTLLSEIRTVGEALDILQEIQLHEPGLKPKSTEYRREILGLLRRTLDSNSPIEALTKEFVRKWWVSIAKQFRQCGQIRI